MYLLSGAGDNLQMALTIFENRFNVDLEVIWVTAWALWNQQNSKVMWGIDPPSWSITTKAREWLEKWKAANEKHPSLTNSTHPAK